jgi:predicted transcriptional regulator of viral defense system
MSVMAALGKLADLAEAQRGLVTTRQAEARGVARRDLARLAAGGGLERVAYGVYRVAGAPRDGLVELRAAWLQLAPWLGVDQRRAEDGVVSHASAAVVYQVGLLEPFRFEFTVPPPRRVRSRRQDVAIHRARLDAEDVAWMAEMVVTVPVRMVADLAAQRFDGDHLAGVVIDVLAKGLTDRRRIESVLAPYAAGYGLSAGDGRGLVADLLGRSGVAS